MSLLRRAPLLLVTLLGCGDATPAASSAAPAASAAPAKPSAAVTAQAASAKPSASAAAAAPAMPSEIASCEAEGAHFGARAITVEQLVLAVGVPDADACLPEEIAAQAVRACAAKLGTTAMKLSTDRFEGTPRGCEVTLAGASAEGREWVALRSVFRDGSRFVGTTKVIELTNGGPKLYLDATGDHETLCPTEAGASEVAAGKAGPEGWGKLGLELQRFLCARAGD